MGEGKKAAAGEVTVNARGEITLPLDGQEYHLRPTRQAISAIEQNVGALQSLIAQLDRGELPIEAMAEVTAELMRAYGAANPADPLAADYAGAKPSRLADLIYEAGSPKIGTRLLVVLIGAMTGGYTASGEAKPAEKKTA